MTTRGREDGRGRMVWLVAWLLVGLWTLAALAGFGLVDLVGGFAVDSADVAARDPDQLAWIAWAFDTLRDLGLAVIVLAWAVIGAIILGVAALITKAMRDRARFTDARR